MTMGKAGRLGSENSGLPVGPENSVTEQSASPVLVKARAWLANPVVGT